MEGDKQANGREDRGKEKRETTGRTRERLFQAEEDAAIDGIVCSWVLSCLDDSLLKGSWVLFQTSASYFPTACL